jgi:uncharacterized protein YdeI (YjbR/CyaY-like superfamily)
MSQELQELLIPDAAAWRAWLAENHDSTPGVWLVLGRKGGMATSLTHAAALDEALCFGWIDGQASKRDEGTWRIRMTPRGPRSIWSARNVELIARLDRENRMHESGWAAVRAAKADGRWERAYAGPATATAPDDLAEAISANPEAQAMYDVLTASNRFAVIQGVTRVKRAETRSRKIAHYVGMLARHETPYPQRRRPA